MLKIEELERNGFCLVISPFGGNILTSLYKVRYNMVPILTTEFFFFGGGGKKNKMVYDSIPFVLTWPTHISGRRIN